MLESYEKEEVSVNEKLKSLMSEVYADSKLLEKDVFSPGNTLFLQKDDAYGSEEIILDTAYVKKLPTKVLSLLTDSYKRITFDDLGNPTNLELLDEVEMKIYQEYIDDYKFLKNYIENPVFIKKFRKQLGLTKYQMDQVMERMEVFFKHDYPQNGLIIDINNINSGNGKTIMFYGREIENAIIVLYKESKNSHFAIHEFAHLIFDKFGSLLDVKPDLSSLDDVQSLSELKSYVSLQDERYPHIFQIRAKYHIKPGQRITYNQACQIIKESDDNPFVSSLKPESLKDILNNW